MADYYKYHENHFLTKSRIILFDTYPFLSTLTLLIQKVFSLFYQNAFNENIDFTNNHLTFLID